MIEYFDRQILARMDVERYVHQCIILFFKNGLDDADVDGRIEKCWKDDKRKRERVLRILRFSGINEGSAVDGRELNPDFVQSIIDMSPFDAVDWLLIDVNTENNIVN